MMITKKSLIGLFGTLLLSNLSYADTFSITPKGELPTTVPQYSKTSAYFTITNKTGVTLNGNFIKNLPSQFKQITCDPKYCGSTFNLGPAGSATESCILKLSIQGPGTSRIPICTLNQSICEYLNKTFVVKRSPSLPFIGIGAGNYTDQFNRIFPLVAVTNDSGNTWLYPPSIYKNLSDTIDPTAGRGSLEGASCSGTSDKTICIAAGKWCDSNCEMTLPLIAVGTNNGANWKYPKSVFQNLTTLVDPNLQGATLVGASCVGTGLCIASGSYFNQNGINFPLIALSTNSGKDWSYPKSVFQNLSTAIEPDFRNANLTTASCSKNSCDSLCIAAGGFCTNTICFQPLISMSTDKGQTWSYPHSVFQNLKERIDPNFDSVFFFGSSCTGGGQQGICIGAGNFAAGTKSLPILVLTQNGGADWSYPKEIFTDLSQKIGPHFLSGTFLSASCTGKLNKAVCIAAGAFFTSNGDFPLIGLSQNGGNTWSYPREIFSKMKTLVDPNFYKGRFEGASCIGNGKKAMCVAAGGYCTEPTCLEGFPLIAVSRNGGASWSYPKSVFKNLNLDPQYQRGFFTDVSCSGVENHNFCVATGNYSTPDGLRPLIAISTDKGNTWTYPPYIFQHLNTTIDPNFLEGILLKSGATGGESQLFIKRGQTMAANVPLVNVHLPSASSV